MTNVLPSLLGVFGADCTMVMIWPVSIPCTWHAVAPFGCVHIFMRRHFCAGLPGSLTVMTLAAGSADGAAGVSADWPHASPDAARLRTTLPILVARTIGLASFVRTGRLRAEIMPFEGRVVLCYRPCGRCASLRVYGMNEESWGMWKWRNSGKGE